ncbi:hypothetical protein ABZ069_38080 [Streptomyces microflavus]|uniref:hypothetical protein n=1 Tax=Streptomyces microflavus TaxID=1919 RepID=UPI0033BDDA41
MQFLEIAATGDWGMATAVATAEDMPWQQWDDATLRAFVDSLAPDDTRDAQHIAADLAPYAQAGQLTTERCTSTPIEWPWLALRAQGEWEQAVEVAKEFLHWAECNGEWLDYLLCQIAQRPEGEGHLAAADLYRHVLLGTFTHQDLANAFNRLIPVAQTAAEEWAEPTQVHTAVMETDALQENPTHTTDRVNVDVTETFASQMGRLLEKGSWIGAHRRVQEEPSQRTQDTRIRYADAERIVPDPTLTQVPSTNVSSPLRQREPLRESRGENPLRELEDKKGIQEATPSSSKQPAPGQMRANAVVMTSVDLSGPTATEKALEKMRGEDAAKIRRINKERYELHKVDPENPIYFEVYDDNTNRPVLVFEGYQSAESVMAKYQGHLRVSEKAGGVGAKAGRFFKAKGKEKLSSGTLAGTMAVTTEGTTRVDLSELTRLLKKSGITDKNLIQG